VPADKRAALEQLRRVLRAAAPKAEEGISYGVPALRLNGKFLVGWAAAAGHCAFYAGSVLRAYREELKDYDLSAGTIRFQANRPLPAALVKKFMRARIVAKAAT
jgi:uncharacterized protein YdhG (YjbR/CyaY superfamily)